jgi:hypothetical protein
MADAPEGTLKVLTDQEAQHLILQAIAANPEGETDETLQRLIDWGIHARLEEIQLDLVLRNKIRARWSAEDGDIVFMPAGVDEDPGT